MKSLRLVLAAAAVATALVPATASAGIQCRVYWVDRQVGPIQYSEPRCAW